MKLITVAGPGKVCTHEPLESTGMNQKHLDLIVENWDKSLGKIKIILETDAEKARLIETQLKKLVDVLEVK